MTRRTMVIIGSLKQAILCPTSSYQAEPWEDLSLRENRALSEANSAVESPPTISEAPKFAIGLGNTEDPTVERMDTEAHDSSL